MNKHIATHLTLSLLAAVFGFAAPVYAATTDLSTQPMAVTGGTPIKPNLLFLLDDSGSMAWDRLSPDTMANTDSNTNFCYMNPVYNGVYYNTSSTYPLPVNSIGANYPNSTFTNAKDDGFDITSPVYHSLSSGFKTGGSSNNSLSNPNGTGGAFYYTYHQIPVTLTVSGTSSTTVSSIKVNSVQLMSGTSVGSTSSSTTAANIAAMIMMNGFSATSSGSIVTITGPATANISPPVAPVVTKSGSDTITVAGTFTPVTPATGTCYPDANYTRVDVTSASAEAQSFANWYSYYRTRILTMKSAVGLAFKNIDNSFRVGFTTINTIDNASPVVVPISDFDATQRALWYADFYAITPNSSTPLRVALADAGRIYAHKLPGAADPVQYSCQQNFTIMTTDGMWNETATPKQVDGTTDIGNPDAAAARPMYDGSSYVKTTKQNRQQTSTQYQNTIQLQANQTQSSTSTLQSSTANLQSSTWPLQSSTSVLQSSTWPLQSSTSNLQSQAYQLQYQTTHLQKQTRTNPGSSWSSWSNVGTCTWASSYPKTSCQYSTVNVSWTNGSCTINNQSANTSNGNTWTGDQKSCQYTTGALTTVTSCTPVAQTTNTANGTVWNASAMTCGYGSYSAAAPAGSCIYKNQSGGSPYAGPAVTCSYGATQTVATVPSCTPVAKSSSTANDAVWDPTAHTCGYSAYSTPANVSSCTAAAPSGASPYTVATATNCTYTAFTAWANANSCTTVAQSTAPNYTVGTATQCQTTWLGVNTCTAGVGGQTACQTIVGSTAAASCGPATASSGNNWTTTSCPPATTTPWVGVSSCTAAAASASNGYVATVCNSSNPVTTVTNVGSCTAEAATALNSWTTTTCSGLTGGTPNTLADTAYYYYQTDLRTAGLGNCTGVLGSDVCLNNVRGAGYDIIKQQHMTTFTLGLGVVGTLDPVGYFPDGFSKGNSTDFNNLITGPNNWPAPVSNTNTTIDDLWHAAVNGHGVYFSAKNPNDLVTGLSTALQTVKTQLGASAAASTSNMQPVPGDSFAYVALFNTVSWDGDLRAKQIDPVTSRFVQDPATGTDLIVWQAVTQLDQLVGAASDTRTIYTFDSSTSNKLKPFTWASLNATEQGYFSNMCTSPYQLSQCSTLKADDLTNGTTNATDASGANLVNFLRGQHGLEDVVTNTRKIYRSRTHVLGDIVSAQPQYVKKPPFDYVDTGYADFKNTNQLNRAPMVYSGANDGMLHAFDGATGTEQWAYIPPMVMNNMYRLASEDYSTNHRYYVDGTPTVADVCPNAPTSTCTGAQWKTILVAGLNGGGRGYYALDVTDPAHPKALWNYTVADQANLGYTYGNPVVAKRKDKCTTLSGVTTCTGGTWVVAITSGYNNVSPGDGMGHLFILNAMTGALLEDIVTTAGDTGTPSGLSRINAWVDYPNDNTAARFYGGDLLGNVWRFDIDNQVPPAGKEALLLAQLGKVDLANFQPVTTKPGLAVVDVGGVSYAGVFVATGRYLGLPDLLNTDQQSIYALKDNLTATGLGLVRTPGMLVKQTVTSYTGGGNNLRHGTNNAVDWAAKSGWYVDLNPGGDSPGERVNVDMNMQQKTLSLIGNVPDNNVCDIGGHSWTYYFNFLTGYLPEGGGMEDNSNSLIAGTTQIMDATGKTHTIITHTDGSITIKDDITPPPPPSFPRRGSWRELTN